jgi:hypothetical protein
MCWSMLQLAAVSFLTVKPKSITVQFWNKTPALIFLCFFPEVGRGINISKDIKSGCKKIFASHLLKRMLFIFSVIGWWLYSWNKRKWYGCPIWYVISLMIAVCCYCVIFRVWKIVGRSRNVVHKGTYSSCMAQAASLWPFTTEAQVQPHISPHKSCTGI